MSEYEELLAQHGHETEDGRWWFSSPSNTLSHDAALLIVEACTLLDVQITDVVTSEAWIAAIRKTTKTEEILRSLQSSHDKLVMTVIELENKLEHARLYGFSITAEDE